MNLSNEIIYVPRACRDLGDGRPANCTLVENTLAIQKGLIRQNVMMFYGRISCSAFPEGETNIYVGDTAVPGKGSAI